MRAARYDLVLSVLKQRTLFRYLNEISRFLRGQPLSIYDQDPWQAYIDGSPTQGCYGEFARQLNISSFMLTSKWWSNFCADRGLPTCFVRMGMLPRYCQKGPKWESREIDCGFQGTLHPHRKQFFDELSASGLPVTVLPSGDYSSYLSALHNIKIYIHTEDAPWQVAGKMLPRNSLWIKDVEVAARGCFAIRNWDEDFDAYDIESIPTIAAFRKVSEVKNIVEEIWSLPEIERQDRVNNAVQTILERDDWRSIISALNK